MPTPPFSQPPRKPEPGASWWKSLPGQAAIAVLAGGAILILLALVGAVGPHAGR